MTPLICCIVLTSILLFILRVVRDISNHMWEIRKEGMKSRMHLEMIELYLKCIDRKLLDKEKEKNK